MNEEKITKGLLRDHVKRIREELRRMERDITDLPIVPQQPFDNETDYELRVSTHIGDIAFRIACIRHAMKLQANTEFMEQE